MKVFVNSKSLSLRCREKQFLMIYYSDIRHKLNIQFRIITFPTLVFIGEDSVMFGSEGHNSVLENPFSLLCKSGSDKSDYDKNGEMIDASLVNEVPCVNNDVTISHDDLNNDSIRSSCTLIEKREDVFGSESDIISNESITVDDVVL